MYTVSRESERAGIDWPGGAVGFVVVWSAPERSVQLEKQVRVLDRGDAFELCCTQMRHDKLPPPYLDPCNTEFRELLSSSTVTSLGKINL